MDKTNNEIKLIQTNNKSYTIIVSALLEAKIRLLCEKFPNKEYSGTLFYKVKGTFEDNNLLITAEDFYLQNIGNSTYTEFQNDTSLAKYMADNMLFNCQMGLIHSHNNMATFFSGTDLQTLKEEGIANNHFVSLIVNNAGEYTAAITRNVISHKNLKVTGTEDIEYNTFYNDKINISRDLNPKTIVKVNNNIEYNYLEVLIEEPCILEKDYFDERIDELTNVVNPITVSHHKIQIPIDFKNNNFYEFDKYDEIPDCVINNHIAQLLTGNILSGYRNINPYKWSINMINLFDKRFEDLQMFERYAANLIDLLADEIFYNNMNVSSWAKKLSNRLHEFRYNNYLNAYIEELKNYIDDYE